MPRSLLYLGPFLLLSLLSAACFDTELPSGYLTDIEDECEPETVIETVTETETVVEYRDIGSLRGCLDQSDAGVVWELESTRLFCVDLGWSGGLSPYVTQIEVEGEGIERLGDTYSTPPEGGDDFPSRWIRVFQAMDQGEAEIVVSSLATGNQDFPPEELFRLQLNVED